MLPYHLRAPIYGGKLKRQREDELSPDSLRNPYIGGGPYQRAIEKDLLDVRGDFQIQLSQIKSIHPAAVDTDDSGPHRDRRRQGLAFGVFKKVFGAAKVARLHTRLAPPRCDQTAYAQLIYAACLSLLKQSQSSSIPNQHHQPEDANHTNQEEKDSDDVVHLSHAAYAVFCLYALYETNPLPVPQGSTDNDNKSQSRQSQLAMLSMGLQNRENPKLLFRRAFRSHIRIDQQHYVYLLTLKDLALSKIADCRANSSGKSQLPRSSSDGDSSDSDSDSESESSSRDAQPYRKCQCHCAIAEDIVLVIDRLWKHLDMCAYTGPCSAEGLAGHADYPFPVNEQAAKAKSVKTLVVPSSSGIPVSTTTNSGVVPVATEPWQISEHLQELLESYLSSRQSIRLPALHANNSQQTKRVRQALEPMFRKRTKQEGMDPLAQLSNTIQSGGVADEAAAKTRTLRRVTFGSIMVGGDTSVVSSKRITGETDADQEESLARGAGAAQAEADHAAHQQESTPSYQLILPDEMPVALQESIQTAVETLMDQGETLLGFSEPACVSDSIHDGDVSTLGTGGISAASTTTGVGRNALQNLLSQVDDGGDASTVTGRGRDALQNLLARARYGDTGTVTARNALHDHLSQAGGEDASTATGIGRSALQDLLAQARIGDTGNATARNSIHDLLSQAGDEDASTSTGIGRSALQDLLARARNGDTGNATARNSLHDLLSQAGDEDASTSTGIGRSALQDLLAQARNGDTGNTTARNSLHDLLSQAGDEDASTATGIGRNALQNLLAQARNRDTDTATGRNSPLDLLSQAGDENGSIESGVGRNKLPDFLSQASMEHSQKPAPRRKQADLFLDTEQDDIEARVGRTSVSSDVDVSDVSSDDEVASVALSCVGKRALDDLLSAGKRKCATTSPKRRVAVRQVRRSRKKLPPPDSAINSIADESEDDYQDEDAQSAKSECVDRGKSALDDLLKLAMGRNE
jgi:hypothetical protein